MKITTKAVYDIESGALLEQECYEYSGPVDLLCPSAALAVGLGIASIGASTVTGIMGSKAASKAANTQAAAADNAAQLEKEAADNSLAEQKRQFDASQKTLQDQNAQNREDLSPWLTQGTTAVNKLGELMGPGGELSQGWTGKFSAPTDITEQNDPGFMARLKLGQQALERSAAARGNVLGGGTMKALDRYGQDYASNEYDKVYNRALGEYGLGYNQFKQNQSDLYNRYANLAGIGQTAAQQLDTSGTQIANSIVGNNTNNAELTARTVLGTAANVGQQGNNAAAARASGYAAGSNALTSGITGGLNNLTSSLLLSKILGQQPGTFNGLGGVGSGAYGPGY